MKDIGKRIRKLREINGITQEELAHKVGYKSRVSINKIELQRDVPLNKLSAIAAALGVTPSYLAGWEDDNFDNLTVEIDPLDSFNLDEDQKRRVLEYIDLLKKAKGGN